MAKKHSLLSALALLLCALLLLSLAACGGGTADTSTEPTLSPEDMLDDFIDLNYSAVVSLNEQFGEIYDCGMYREGLSLVFEFILKVDGANENFAKSMEAGDNTSFVELRNSLSEYTDNPDAEVIVRALDSDGKLIYETAVTKDTPLREVEGAAAQYGSLAELVASPSIQAQIGAQNTDDVYVIAEAEDANTLLVRYQLQHTYEADALAAMREQQAAIVQGDELTQGMRSTRDAVAALLGGREIEIHVRIEDLSGAVLAERTFTAADFAE